jgi:phosphoesterase RecJ-like protein
MNRLNEIRLSVCVPSELIDMLASARRPVVIGHVTPDTDVLGAMLALARSLPQADVALSLERDRLSSKTGFLLDLMGEVPMADAKRVADADVVVVLDTASPRRASVAGGWEVVADKPIINIDHHITNTDFGRINWVVDNAASTCELVHSLIVSAGWSLDATSASLLYAGLWADTSGFSLPSVSSETFEVAAALVRAGADIEQIGLRLGRSHEPHEFDLLRTVYHNTRLAADGRVAYSTLTHQEIVDAGCTADDIDEQVSIPRSLSGIRIAILFSEGKPGAIRINLRGEDGTPVLPLAEKIGGGGHTFSAGARIRGDMGEVVKKVLDEAARALDLLR